MKVVHPVRPVPLGAPGLHQGSGALHINLGSELALLRQQHPLLRSGLAQLLVLISAIPLFAAALAL